MWLVRYLVFSVLLQYMIDGVLIWGCKCFRGLLWCPGWCLACNYVVAGVLLCGCEYILFFSMLLQCMVADALICGCLSV